MNLYGSICLSEIPAELVQTAKNGKKYLNIEVGERRNPSSYGSTHYVKMSARREQRREGVNYYIGDLKPSQYNNTQNQQVAPQPQPQPQAQARDFTAVNDDGYLDF